MDSSNSLRNDVKHLLNALRQKTKEPYILVGGASLVLYGSSRTTDDVDLLVRRNNSFEFSTTKDTILKAETYHHIKQIDILNALVDRIDFDSIKSFTEDIEGVKVPDLDVLLGSKVLSYHARTDGEAGDKKRASDLSDIHWISQELKKQNAMVRKEVSDKMVCGSYNMLLVVSGLYDTFGTEGVKVFELVGGREFECDPDNIEFKDQVEFYQMEIEAYEDDGETLSLLQSRRGLK